MFNPSTISVSAACQEIADTVGASGESDITTRASRSLFAGIKYLNGRQNWSWLLTEATPISVIAPFSVSITAGATGVASASADAGHGVLVDDYMTGSGFTLGTRVTATGASAIGFNRTLTVSGSNVVSATRDFYDLPTDWKQPYTVKLLFNRRTLYPAQRRGYDRSEADEFAQSTPQWYDLYSGFQKGKIRLLPPPNASDTLFLRYYRRMTVPTTSATADVLDIPQDYDFHLIAWAKWHFLTDKADGRSDQATTWMSLAQEGIKVMLSDQMRQPDEDLAFTPGRFHLDWNTSSTRALPWEYS